LPVVSATITRSGGTTMMRGSVIRVVGTRTVCWRVSATTLIEHLPDCCPGVRRRPVRLGSRLNGDLVAADLELVDMQPLDARLAHRETTYRKAANRQGADGDRTRGQGA
jgi:hypothetical protein